MLNEFLNTIKWLLEVKELQFLFLSIALLIARSVEEITIDKRIKEGKKRPKLSITTFSTIGTIVGLGILNPSTDTVWISIAYLTTLIPLNIFDGGKNNSTAAKIGNKARLPIGIILLWSSPNWWVIEPLKYYFSALILAGIILSIPRNWLSELGNHWYGTANAICIWRLIIFILGFALFTTKPTVHYLGFNLMAISLLLDRTDGTVARIKQEEKKNAAKAYIKAVAQGTFDKSRRLKKLLKTMHSGVTRLGKWLDPLIDKLTIPPLIVYFWYAGAITDNTAIILQIVAELTGTILRDPFKVLERFDLVLMKLGRQPLNIKIVNAASGIGKLKTVTQYTLVLVCLPVIMKWYPVPATVIHIFVYTSTLMAWLSVITRFKPEGKIGERIEDLTKAFSG